MFRFQILYFFRERPKCTSHKLTEKHHPLLASIYGLVSDMNVNTINNLCGRCNYLSSSTVALDSWPVLLSDSCVDSLPLITGQLESINSWSDFSPLPNSWKEEIYMCIKNTLTFELQFINDFPIKHRKAKYIYAARKKERK